MAFFLQIRDNLRNIYSRFEIYILPVLKFLLALMTLMVINSSVGYNSKLTSMTVVLVIALMCSFLPMNILVVISAAFIVLHMYAVSLECAIVVLALFVILFLLYYRFAPKDILVVIFLPLLFGMKIPVLVAILAGLLCGPASVVSVACGVIVYYVLSYVKANASIINSLDVDNAIGKFRYLIDGLLNNKTMVVMVAALCITTVVVFALRRLSVNYAWTIAMCVGGVCNVVVVLMGNLKLDTSIPTNSTIIGTVVAILLAKIVQFFAFNVDYTRTEYVQFEDDEYYYYVKAIPKNSVSKANHTVKKITSVL